MNTRLKLMKRSSTLPKILKLKKKEQTRNSGAEKLIKQDEECI